MSKKIKIVCENCGKEFFRYAYQIKAHVFCSRDCSRQYLSEKMKRMNAELNPTRMTEATKEQVRKGRLRYLEREGIKTKQYPKIHSRHDHRVVAERMIGGALLPGEVVHHINGDKTDNRPDNLMVFSSQSEHVKWHAEHKAGDKNEI